MNQERIRELLAKFDAVRVLVVGDVYLDENTYGVMTGISLEAPVPIFEVQERRYNPGAAGNAACNAAALGAKTCIVGVVGDDMNGEIVRREFVARHVDTSGLVAAPASPTNTYGKLRAGTFNAPSQEVLRTDTPRAAFIEGETEARLIANIRERAGDVDAIIVGDQISSVATERVLAAVVECAREHGLLTVGDSRERAGAFKEFDIVVPNDREAGIGTGIDVVDEDSLRRAGTALTRIAKNALVTRGPAGITVFAENGTITDVPITPCSVVDVTGAGDTVTAAVAVTRVAGGTLEEAAVIANAAAGIAVGKHGVVTVPRAEVEAALCRKTTGPAKVKSLDELKEIVRAVQAQGKRVVWTNGCYDILHVGHITYLTKAARLGDVMVVGLNSDASVQAIKGPNRPVVNEADRAFVLSSLEFVDYVTVFSDPTPMTAIETLRPDVYAKGGDYTIDTINQDERRLVEGYAGRIEIIPGVEGQSTTAIIDRILAEANEGDHA